MKGKIMRRILLPGLIGLLLLGCGDDEITSSDGEIEISVSVSPGRTIIELDADQQFTAFVFGTGQRDVIWYVEDIEGGNSTFGTIDSSGLYTAPSAEPDIDSIKVTAILQVDPSKLDDAWVLLSDPTRIYVDTSGSDTEGTGSRLRPYRTITYALTQWQSGQIIEVGEGTFDLDGGETFPIQVGTGVSIRGVDKDSTFVVGPGASHDETGSVFSVNGDAITISKLNISTVNSSGVGVWLLPGIQTKIRNTNIGPNYIGIFADGANMPRPFIESNVITGDSIGIATGDDCEPIVRDNQITDCGLYGVNILDTSRPDMGVNDSTGAGGNTIRDCGPNNHWLVYNMSPDTIMAIGNTWVIESPIDDNDQFIYDDEESGGSSGPVLLENQ
jgi:hypothetical protein